MFKEDILRQLSVKTNLGYSMNRGPGKLEDDMMKREVHRAVMMYNTMDPIIKKEVESYPYMTDYRIKSLQSALLKIERRSKSSMKNVFNDILSFRVVAPYSKSKVLDVPYLREVDMTNGKKIDDGYRGKHYYFQIDNYHYPIEIQWWSEHDKLFNNWLHKSKYKVNDDFQTLSKLRTAYDNHEVHADDLEEAYYVLFNR